MCKADVGFSEEIKNELIKMGASLVGFADLRGLPANQRDGFNYGISIVVAVKAEVINGISNGPTKEYYDEYNSLNKLLDSLDLKAEEIIRDRGYNVLPKTRANVKINYKDHSTILPHKTVATRAGMGWIGKCALLVTKEYGSAVRISSVLTDAPLDTNEPIDSSKCGNCENCVRNCPADALSGGLWYAGRERKGFYDFLACRNKALQRTWKISPGETHCGLCVLVCPHTKNYIASSGLKYEFPSVDMAVDGDLEEILALQKLAYLSEAEIYSDFEIQPLNETLEDLYDESKYSIIMKVVEDRKIVGSVRAFGKDGSCYIGKLIVHPDYQNKGLGKKLIMAIERCFKGYRYELYTGHLSEKNLALYEKLGYKRFKEEKVSEKLSFVFLEKQG